MNRRTSPIAKVLTVITIFAVCAACGGSPPEILHADAQVFLVQDLESGYTGESLRLYVAVNDGDGVEDLSVLSVVHDESELFWQVSAEEWTIADQDGDSWIGLPDMRPVHGDIFPRGRYRLLLEDEALQEVEGNFSITASPVSPDEQVFPSLATLDGAPSISADSNVVIRVYNRTEALVLSREVSVGPLGASFMRELPGESGLQAYLATLPGAPVRLLSGPYPLER